MPSSLIKLLTKQELKSLYCGQKGGSAHPQTDGENGKYLIAFARKTTSSEVTSSHQLCRPLWNMIEQTRRNHL